MVLCSRSMITSAVPISWHTGSKETSLKFPSSLLGIRGILNTEVVPMDKDLLMQKMPVFWYMQKQKGREPGGLSESHRRQVQWSPRSGLVLSWWTECSCQGGLHPPFSWLFSFPLQMIFGKSNYTNFLPCGLHSVLTWWVGGIIMLTPYRKNTTQLCTHECWPW